MFRYCIVPPNLLKKVEEALRLFDCPLTFTSSAVKTAPRIAGVGSGAGQPGPIHSVHSPPGDGGDVRKLYNTDGSLLIQQGSYQWISLEDQPHVENGEALLYRGIRLSS